MKIALISLSTPTTYNCVSASALPYHLAKYRSKDIKLDIYSFNYNNIDQEKCLESEKDLKAKIHIIPFPKWFRLIFKLHLQIIRIFMKYPFMAYINLPKEVERKIKESNPDAIWI